MSRLSGLSVAKPVRCLAAATALLAILTVPVPAASRQEDPARQGPRSPELEEIQLRFAEAEEMFFSADQPESISLFDRIISALQGREWAAEEEEATALLVDSLAYRAEAAFNLGDAAAAEADLREILTVDPGAEIAREQVSPKLTETFDALRDELVGTVRVDVTPRDAHVHFNGDTVEWREGPVALAADTYGVSIERPGYGFLKRELTVEPGTVTPLEAELERESAVITLGVRPGDVTIAVDGEPVTPFTGPPGAGDEAPEVGENTSVVSVDDLGVGEHELAFSSEGYRTFETTVEVQELTDYRLDTVVLEPTAGVVMVEGLPADATMEVDSEPVEAPLDEVSDGTGTARLELRPGSHRIEVDGGVRGTWATEFELADEEELRIDVRLRPVLAYLGTLGGDRMAAERIASSVTAALEDSETFGLLPAPDEGLPLLREAGLEAGTLRDQLARGTFDRSAVPDSLIERVPASAYLLAVLDDDLMASRAELLVWPAPPGPPILDRLTLDLADGSVDARLAEALHSPVPTERAWIGALLVDTDVARGPAVFRVDDGSPAADAGLRVGDVVVEVDGSPASGAAELMAGLSSRESGSDVQLTLQRPATRISTTLVLGSSPMIADPSDDRIAHALLWLSSRTVSAREPEAETAWIHSLNQAAALIHARQWESAVRALRAVQAPREAVGQPMVDYWLGLALSELGPAYYDRARDVLRRAAGAEEGRLYHRDGPLIAPLARAPLATLDR